MNTLCYFKIFYTNLIHSNPIVLRTTFVHYTNVSLKKNVQLTNGIMPTDVFINISGQTILSPEVVLHKRRLHLC